MGRSFYIITGLVGFLVGVFLYLIFQPSFLVLFAIIVISGFALFVAKKPILCINFVFIIAVSIGLLRAGVTERSITTQNLEFYNGQKVALEGIINEVDIRRDKAKYAVKIYKSGVDLACSDSAYGKILITLDKYPQLSYGDRVSIYGQIETPETIEDFNYGQYLSRYGIYSVMYRPSVKVLESGQGNFFWAVMSKLQNAFLRRINRIFPEPHASFEAGLLVGARKGISPELMEKFNITGLTHIIAISGYNITIIIIFVMWIFKWMPRMASFYSAVSAIVLFTLFVGASPAVTRASIMGILGLIALNYGRSNNINLTVLWSAALMVLWNPKILWWDVGFQLSFAAVLGLIYVAPHFESWAKKLPETFAIREALQMTLAAQVMALPIIIYTFDRLSIIAPLANLVVIFAIPPAMMFGFLAVVTSFFWPLSIVFGYIAYGILSYIIKMIEIMASVPYASIDLPGMRVWMLFGYYALLIALLFRFRNRNALCTAQE